ncbi:MAG: hypothetical protein RLZZ312_746 [Bacteroidota bacterium]|jgi:hypothetical protein
MRNLSLKNAAFCTILFTNFMKRQMLVASPDAREHPVNARDVAIFFDCHVPRIDR